MKNAHWVPVFGHLATLIHFPEVFYCLLFGLSFFSRCSHASTAGAHLGSFWELNPASLSRNPAKSSKNLALLHSKSGSFSLKLSWDFSTCSCNASVVNTASGLHVWTPSGFIKSVESANQPCSLHLEDNGNLVLKHGDLMLWESHTNGLDVQALELLDNGNLILLSKANYMIWQSFDDAKDTLILQLASARRDLQEISPSGAGNAASAYDGSTDEGHRNKGDLAMEVVLPVAAFLLIAFCVAVVLFKRKAKASQKAAEVSKRLNAVDETMLESLAPGLPPRFTYAEMEEATNGFQKKLGEGGYGVVYEGFLSSSGTGIAVKVFIDTASTSCRKGFCAEVMSIGEKKHYNLVQLCGFCAEDEHRMLVYELMVNGSLNKVLFGGKERGAKDAEDEKRAEGHLLSWERRRAIAIDTARALAFLHEGDEQRRVIHCDVKPENILLNEKWEAKVSDFGLAKLLWSARHHNGEDNGDHDGKLVPSTESKSYTSSMWDGSRLSFLSGLISSKGVRGTLGYLAPEWVRADGGPDTVTTASDVYSFGVVLLELVAGRRSMVPGHPFLPGHAFDLLTNGHDLTGLLDPRLHTTSLDLVDVRTVANIALWCLQEDVVLRPTMADVLDMLTNHAPVSSPPVCDYFVGSSHFFDENDHHHQSTSTTTFNTHKESDSSTTTSHFTNSWQISILSGR